MGDRLHGPLRLGAIGIALGLALGLLLMHGLDARAAGEGHGLLTSPSALVSSVDALDRGAGVGDATVRPSHPHRAMVHLCIALLAAGLALLPAGAARRFQGYRRFARSMVAKRRVIASLGRVLRERAPPSTPRVALCVSLS